METNERSQTLPNARATGITYLLYFLAAFLSAYLLRGIVVAGDVAATVSGITMHAGRYQAGCAVDLLANAIYIALTAMLYWLFAPVHRGLSMLAAFLSLAGCSIQLAAGAFQLAPLLFIQNLQLSTLAPEQLRAATLMSLTVHAQAIRNALVLFGLFDIVLGYLIVKSAFVPRALGVVLMVAGTGWLTFVWTPLSTVLSPVVLPFGGVAEIALMLWLVVKGGDMTARQRDSIERART